MKIGYVRVSSTGQNEDAQVGLLARHGAEELFIDKPVALPGMAAQSSLRQSALLAEGISCC